MEQLERKMTGHGAIIHQFQQGSIANYHNLYRQAALNMMGGGNDPLNFKGPLCDS